MVSHSAGTIYILNAVLKLRDRLHPTNPLLYLLCKWRLPVDVLQGIKLTA